MVKWVPDELTAHENPKQVFGDKKVAMSYVPAPVLMEIAIGMAEGGIKYGSHNYRETPVKASTYYNAALRHLMQWWEGEDEDTDSHLSHITKTITSLIVLRDAMMYDKFIDDRPPPYSKMWMEMLNTRYEEMKKRCDTTQNPIQSELFSLDQQV